MREAENVVETPLGIIAEVGEPKWSLRRPTEGQKPALSCALGRSQSQVQAPSPSAQVKEAVGQVDDRNWNWEKRILCSTVGVE